MRTEFLPFLKFNSSLVEKQEKQFVSQMSDPIAPSSKKDIFKIWPGPKCQIDLTII